MSIFDPISTGINAWISASQNKKQREFDRSMAEYSYSKDLEMWNKANEYNSPQNQMQRFEDAGLNKHLIYSQGQPGLASSSMPKYQDVKGTFGLPQIGMDFASAISLYQDFQIKNKQKDLLAEQIGIAQENRNTAYWEAQLKELEVALRNPNKDKAYEILGRMTENGFQPRALSDFGYKSQTEYDLQRKQLENDLLNQKIPLTEYEKKWAIKKYNDMVEKNFNIDKDAMWERWLNDILGGLIKKYANKIVNKSGL